MCALVVCSNTDNESVTTAGQSNSIFKGFNFRNSLSSTMMLPANCQVALQSCKYNVDGRIALGNRTTFYIYFGEDIKETETDLLKSTAVPVRVEINSAKNIEEYTADELAVAIADALNSHTYHPNQRNQCDCITVYDANGVFTGFKYSFGLFTSTSSTIPADSTATFWGITTQQDDTLWSYESGVFTTNEVPTEKVGLYEAVVMLQDKPISLYDGTFTVDFSDPNDANIEWAVGLSRYAKENYTDYPTPPYYDSDYTDGIGEWKEAFYGDYVVHRDGDNLRVSVSAGYDGQLSMLNINYTDNTESEFSGGSIYNLNTNSGNYQKVKFTLSGQKVKIELIDDGDASVVLIDYQADATDKRHNLPPISQTKWQMHPILYIESDEVDYDNTLTVEEYVPCSDLTNFDITKDSWNFSSAFDYVDLLGDQIENRPYNNYDNGDDGLTTYAGISEEANAVIELSNIIITKPDSVYVPSHSANTSEILGFVGVSPFTDFTYADEETVIQDFTSVSIPSMTTPKSLFVRLGNMTQSVMNAHNGNRSSIIAHLPKRDESGNELGSLFYEPSERVYLDLGNSNPIPINSFDISISYVNEQFAEIVSGQTIVCLLFREKPK
jgi:hypothetical protein